MRATYSRLSLSSKIVVPFVSFFLFISLMATIVFGYWISVSLESGLSSEVDGLSALVIQQFESNVEHQLREQATLLAERRSVRAAVTGHDNVALDQALLPIKATQGYDLVKVVDARGTPLLDLRSERLASGVLHDEREVAQVLKGISFADLVTVDGEPTALMMGYSPVKSSDGIVGGLILGSVVNADLLSQISAGTNVYLAAFNKAEIFATTLPAAGEASWRPPPMNAPPLRVSIGGNEYVAKSATLHVQEADTGLTVVVLKPTAAVDATKEMLWQRLGALFLFCAFLAIMIGRAVSGAVARPLAALIPITERLARGDLTARAVVTSRDEVGNLARSFNVMAEQLAEHDGKLSSALTELERHHVALQQSLRQMQRLQEVSATFAANLELAEVLQRIGKALIEILDACSIWILTTSIDGEGLEGRMIVGSGGIDCAVLPALFGVRDELAMIAVGDGSHLLSKVAIEKQPAFIGDVAELSSQEIPRIFGKIPDDLSGIRSLAAIPLLLEGATTGVVVLAHDQPKSFTAEQQAMTMVFANQAALAINNAGLYQEVKWMSEVDALTGLYNYRKVHDLLRHEFEISHRYGHPLSIMVVDIDNFKLFNDTYGHLSGDNVLKQSTRVLRASCRNTDIVGRYGGDELIVVLPETTSEQAVVVAERFLERLAAEIVTVGGKYNLPIGCSVGIACFPDDAGNLEAIIHAADAAMYDAKRSGGNRVAVAGTITADVTDTSGESWSTFDSFVAAVDNKDRYTRKHSDMVTEFALALARMLGLPPTIQDQVRTAGLLHDVGKIGVPPHILQKPGPLTGEERQIMEQHPLFGALIIQQVPHLEHVLDGVRHHHERYDGEGYPHQLKGQEIPLLARLLAVADAYAAMVTDRPYRKALDREEAMAELRAHKGTQFDPQIVEAFLAWLESQPEEQAGDHPEGTGAAPLIA